MRCAGPDLSRAFTCLKGSGCHHLSCTHPSRPIEEHLTLMLSGEALVDFGTAPPEELAHDALHWISQKRHVLEMRNSERKMRCVE